MKTYLNHSLAALCLAALALSCQKAQEVIAPEENPNLITLTCAFPTLEDQNGTKVTLSATGKTAWEADVDQIVFQGCPKVNSVVIPPVTHTFTSAELVDPEVASFEIDLSSLTKDEGLNHDINVAYPASIWSTYSPDHMYGRSGFSETNHMLMAGYVDGSSIVLKHVTAAITFIIPGALGDYDSYTFEGVGGDEIVGYSRLLVEVNKPNVDSYRKKYKTSAPYGTSGPLTKISGTVVSDGATVNTIFLPVNTKRSGESPDYTYDGENENGANITYLPNGFTIKLLKGGVIKKYITSTAPLSIRPGHMINLGEIPAAAIRDYVAAAHNSSVAPVPADNGDFDLSKAASANCYIISGEKETPATDEGNFVNAGNIYKFKAYKGKSASHVGTIQSVGVLWETYNNDTDVTKNTVVAAVDFDKQAGNEYYEIVFQLPAQANFHRGNAVIAAYDGPYEDGKPTGNILWSWHIWIPNNDVVSGNVTDATVFGNKPIMDRNLGALVAAPADAAATVESYGLLYQWGRKDPFPGNKGVTTKGAASVSGTVMTTLAGTMTIDATIKNPTVFARSADDKDWAADTDHNNSLWSSTKTIYDPCPPGYIVPTRNTSVHYWGSTKLNELPASDNFADNGATYYSYRIGTSTPVVFPYAGYIQMAWGDHYKPGLRTYVWSSYASSSDENVDKAYTVYARTEATAEYRRSERGKCLGASVRCVAE